jgi:ubiquinone/menaquinone biosynthesis C-methylase UbiE
MSVHADKLAAIEQWTADPCGSSEVDLEPGSAAYFDHLIRMRREYAPWMAEALGYAETAGLRVLDVGCGQGIDVACYAMAGAYASGVDLTPRHVELARAHTEALGLEADIVEADAERLPFDDQSFDRVSSNGVLHHTPDMPAALREIRRVLAPGGEARVIVYNRVSFHYWLQQFLLRGILLRGLLRERSMEGVLSSGVEYSSIGARPLVRVYSPRQVRRMLSEACFERVETHVRHFKPSDTFLTAMLEHRIKALRDPSVLDRIGRIGGWYVVGRGIRGA